MEYKKHIVRTLRLQQQLLITVQEYKVWQISLWQTRALRMHY